MRQPDRFTAATWNTAGGTASPPTPAQLQEIAEGLRHDNVSVLFAQEVHADSALPHILRDLGFGVHETRPESLVAWGTERWTCANRIDEDLSVTPYFRPGSDRPVLTKAARAILCDDLGRTLDATSAHTASHVQVPDAPDRRLDSLRECMERIGEIAQESECRAVLVGSDDNVDETPGVHGPWPFMLEPATGLRLVQAPAPTHGDAERGRQLDDFRCKGLIVGRGSVRPGGGDHRVHVRRFGWQPARHA